MHQKLQEICDSLDSLSETIIESWSSDQKISDVYGWNHPQFTRYDLAIFSSEISKKIKITNIIDLSSDCVSKIESIPNRLHYIESSVVPHFFNGNGKDAVSVYLMTLDFIKIELSFLDNWETLKDSNLLPPQLIKKLNRIQSELDGLMPDKEEVQKSLNTIREATETIESLPTDIETLKNSKKIIDKNEKDSNVFFEKIKEMFSESEKLSVKIYKSDQEATKLVEQCEDAYRITTTKGLAAAFDQRASKLRWSMSYWVIGLLFALVAGAWIGSVRFAAFSDAIKGPNQSTGIIIMEFIISILSIGAPVWFSWIATKQIGQRFKLAEDYGFKASVAKAYEGYKKEAIRIDEKLEHRLFSSALTRLEEAPLRLMDIETHGSPWHELFDSEQFKKALDNVPEFKTMVFDLVKEAISKSPSKNGEYKKAQDVTKED